ncbi:MAG: glycosyl hydrolase 53 family protein [Agathobacter sp.]|nr:glycosyl hydrolase 53 family protein [Agathobacter sp.]
MQKKGWKKRAVSVALTAAMVVSQIGVWNTGWGLDVVKAEDINYITNGDFSTDASGWTLKTDSAGTASESLTFGSGDGRTGKGAYISNGSSENCNAYFTRKIDKLPAGKYTLSAYIMGEGCSGANAVVNGEKINDAWVKTPGWVTDAAGWAKLEYTFEVKEDKSDYVVGLDLWAYQGGKWSYIDDISLVKADEESGNTDPEETYLIEKYKRDFNGDNEDLSEWTANVDSSGSIKNAIEESQWKLWSKAAQTMTFSHTVENLDAGRYYFSEIAVGGSMKNENCKITLTNGDNQVESNVTMNAWEGSSVTKTDAITLTETGSITITMVYDMADGGWCNLDDMVLYKSVTLEEKTAYEFAELQKLITAYEALNPASYSASSWEAFSAALSAAKAVTNEAALADIDTAIKNLKAAKSALKESGIYVKKVEGLSEDFIRGVDISSYVSIVDSGATFKDESGNVLDNAGFFQLLADSGVNYVRVRIWNNPYTKDVKGYGGGNSDLEKAKKIGKLAADAGMKTLIDFHYSDFWADPERQYSPKAWRNYTEEGKYGEGCNDGKYTEKTVEEKETLLYNYTYESLTALIDAGVDVGMVQVGNETNNGMAGVGASGDWTDVCKLYKKGSEAVRAVAKDKNKDILVALHFTDPQTIGKYDEFAGKLAANQVDYDVFASSYYPNIHGSMENLTGVLSDVAEKYNKKVMVAETAWAWTTKDGDGHSSGFNTGNNPDYSVSVQGQANEVRDVVQAVVNVKNNAGIGVFYWEPAWIPVQYAYDGNGSLDSAIKASNETKWAEYGSGWAAVYSGEYDPEHGGPYYGGSVKDAEAFFDFEGTPLNSLTVFKDIYTGRTGTGVEIDVIKNAQAEVLLQTSDVTSALDTIKAALPKTVTGINNDSSRVQMAVAWDMTKVEAINDFGSYSIPGTVSYKDKEENDKTATVSCELNVLPKSIVENGDFESGNTGWKVAGSEGVSIVWNDTPLRGTGAMHYWSPNAMNFTLTQNVTAEEAGIYRASLQAQGADGEPNTIDVAIKNTRTQVTKNATATVDGWANWKKAIAEGIEVQAGDTIVITITITAGAGGWGSIDDVFLYKTGEYSGSESGSGSGSTPSTPTTPSKDDTSVTKNPDGTTTETKTETTTNESGKEVEVTITTEKDTDGNVTGSKAVSVIAKADENTSATVTVSKDAAGKVTDAAAEVTQTGTTATNGVTATISGNVVSQIAESAGVASVEITVNVTDAEGKTKYTVSADAKDLTAGNKLQVVAIDTKTKEYILVNAKTYKVSASGDIKMTLISGQNYELVSTKEATAISNAILKTVKVKKSSASVKKGKTTTVKMSSKLNMDNVKMITYTTSKKSVATVSKNGKVTAKKAGTVTIKAKVTLNNGKTKTVSMKVKVKK